MIHPSAKVPIGSVDGKSVTLGEEWVRYLTVEIPRALGLAVYTAATLPAAASMAYTRAFVSDANATTFASIVAGGGTNGVPVWSDGTDWRIG